MGYFNRTMLTLSSRFASDSRRAAQKTRGFGVRLQSMWLSGPCCFDKQRGTDSIILSLRVVVFPAVWLLSRHRSNPGHTSRRFVHL